MSLKENLLKLKNKLNQENNKKIPEHVEEMNYIYPNNDEEFNTILIDTINNFFPKTGSWHSGCFRRSNETLQSNLRNNKLLAKKIQMEANLPNEYYNKILDYINSSNLFREKVYEYEQKIVKWQIDYMMHDGEGWLCDDNLGGDLSLILPYCDIAFRKGVVDTLLAMGLDKDAIEEGLEKNADMWRNHYIEKAFKVQYEPLKINFFGTKNFEPLPDADLSHKQAWIKMRKYEYYCNHKKSVDLYGTVEPDMMISKEELTTLKNYLEVENAKRLDFIEQHENNSEKTKKLH